MAVILIEKGLVVNLKQTMGGVLVMGILWSGCSGVERSSIKSEPYETSPACQIGVPADPLWLKQGEGCSVMLVLRRPILNRQDVLLTFEAARAIELSPASVTVNTSDKSIVKVHLKTNVLSEPGDYSVTVIGRTDDGVQTRAVFRVRVLVRADSQFGMICMQAMQASPLTSGLAQ